MIDPADTRTLPLAGIPPAGVPVDQVETRWQCTCTVSDPYRCGAARMHRPLSPWLLCLCGCHRLWSPQHR